MSEGHSTYTPKSGLGRWVDARMPLPRLVYDSFIAYPVPRNLNYAWTFGGILSIMLVAQILTGVVLAMHYVSDTVLAFNSVEKIVRDVNQGWLLRYLHANGASFFFVAVYIHIFRGLYYGSYKAPRELLWILGCIIYLLMMATGFMGYVLPWGQMSFWGATVITGFFSAIPLVGDWIQQLLLGGFAVDNATLNRFYSLHYLLPFMIFSLYSGMKSVNYSMIEASSSMGASTLQTFLKVYLPSTLPAVYAGCLSIFILAIGFYITPALMGGPSETMISVYIQQQIQLLNWSEGTLMAACLVGLLVVLFGIYNWAFSLDNLTRRTV